MNIFKIFSALSAASVEVQKALADKELTVKEIMQIIEDTLSVGAGVTFDDIGLKITKVEGKTKIEFFVNDKE